MSRKALRRKLFQAHFGAVRTIDRIRLDEIEGLTFRLNGVAEVPRAIAVCAFAVGADSAVARTI
jgi:hypothetical protein